MNNFDINNIYERIIEENEEKDLNKLVVNYNRKVNTLTTDLLSLKITKHFLKDEESIKGINNTIKIIEHNKDFYEDLVNYIINRKVVNKMFNPEDYEDLPFFEKRKKDNHVKIKVKKMKNLKREGGDKRDRCKRFNDKRYSRYGY